jgi:hypothetical protein
VRLLYDDPLSPFARKLRMIIRAGRVAWPRA